MQLDLFGFELFLPSGQLVCPLGEYTFCAAGIRLRVLRAFGALLLHFLLLVSYRDFGLTMPFQAVPAQDLDGKKHLEPDFRFLIEEANVDSTVLDRFRVSGLLSLADFAALEDSPAGVRAALKDLQT